MSEDNDNNNTSSIDQAATVVAAINDDVSASLNSALLGNSNDSAIISGASVSSDSSIDFASMGSLGSGAASLASAYSAGVMSALDQTYYAGALGRAASLASPRVAVTPPMQDKTKYAIAATSSLAIGRAAYMAPAAASGQATLYVDYGSGVFGGQAVIGNPKAGAFGAAIFQQTNGLVIRSGAALGVGDNSQLWVGASGTGDLGLTYDDSYNVITPNGRSLWLHSSSYLSAAGYLGGVADKSWAGGSLGLSDTGLRTNALNTEDDVVVNLGADWGTVGDYRGGRVVPSAVVGNNNKFVIGGNVGVFLNASVTVGDNMTMSAATQGGSGIFIGSGGYYSGGANGNYIVNGGMGAAYINQSMGNAARLYLGNGNSVTLNQANWGNFAAQASATVAAGDDFYLRALEMSVGYAQVPTTGAAAPGGGTATMTIGNNATLVLGQSGLSAYSSGGSAIQFFLGVDGAMIVDGIGAKLTIGTGAHITGQTISIGNFAKEYSGVNPQTGKDFTNAYYITGNNNQITIGAGATITLSGGIGMDGNNNYLTLLGDAAVKTTITAGSISAGRFYREYLMTPLSGSKYKFDDTSGTTLKIGDNYNITLVSGTVSTGLANQPTISNNGNLMVNAVNGVFTLGNNVTLNANSMVVGDYYISTQYLTKAGLTTGASITYGTGATINLSGAVLLNGSNDKMVFGDGLTLTAATMSFGIGSAGGVQTNTQFSTGANAKLTISNGFTDTLSNGIVQFGTSASLHLLAGDLVIGGTGGGTSRSLFHMGANNSIVLDTGSILMKNGVQTFDWVSDGVIQAVNFNISGNDQIVKMGTGNNVTLTGGMLVAATSAAITFGDNTVMTLGAAGLTFNNSATFTYGGGGSFAASGDVTFGANATGTKFSMGAVKSFQANNFIINANSPVITFGTGIVYTVVGWQLNGASNKVTLGDGASGSLGDISASGTGGSFNTGAATTLSFGTVKFSGSANSFTLNATTSAKGGSISLAGDSQTFNLTAPTLGLTGGITVDATNSTITVGANTNLSIGTNLVFNQTTTFTFNGGGSFAASGDVTFGANATGTKFSMGAVKSFQANNFIINANSPVITFGTGIVYTVVGWQLNGASNKVTLGDGASGSLGDISASGTGGSFNTGAATTLSFGTVKFSGSANSFTLNATTSAKGGSISLAGDSQTFNLTAPTLGLTGGITVDATNSTITVGANTNLSIGTNLVFNQTTTFTFNGGGSFAASGDVTFGANATGTKFSMGAVKSFQANNFIINANSPVITFGTGIVYTVVGWQLNGASNKVTLGDGASGSLGDISASGTGGSFNTGAATTLSFGTVKFSGSANSFTLNATTSAKGGSISLAGDSQTFNLTAPTLGLTGGITVDATNSTITVGANTNLSIGTNLVFNQTTTFTFNGGGSFAASGDVTFGANATGSKFNVGNISTFTADNVTVNSGTTALNFTGTGINYQVATWNLNGSGNSVVLGDGATGSLGNINAIDSTFNVGNASGLTFGTATLSGNSTLTLSGSVSGNALALSGTSIVNVADGLSLNLTSLTMDGTGQVTINLGAGSNLNVSSLSTINVGTTNMPKIVMGEGSTVTVAGRVTRALSGEALEVDFNNTTNGIYHYEGNIQEASGNLTITNFALTNEAVFKVDAAYSDETRYVTSVVDGVLYIQYVNATTGNLDTVATFAYSPSTSGQAVPNVIITPTTASTTGYEITITKCFLTGTHILTPEGEVAVEALKVGDSILALENGQQVSKRIVWAGSMDVNVNNYEHKDTLYPVRIKAHAFGLNQPCRDLLITPEHTIYVDGGLIPARMLVNGRSIITDTSMDRFTVYHIETETHSILLSENLTTESYLNTDDGHLFNQDAVNLRLTFNENAGHQSWEKDAAAPLTVARNLVESIWQRLDRRATQQGYGIVSRPETTKDPQLCLITQKGERLQPVDIKNNVYSFYVPANVSIVAMHSKAALPSEVIGPFLDDRRMLGVLVSKISIFGERNETILPVDMTALSGWHAIEMNRTDRWTKGLATLPEIISEVSEKSKFIRIELTATAEYFVETIETEEKIA